MHHILCSLKRAGLLSLAEQRKWLAPFGITPARYEMLVVIANTNMWLKKVHFVQQSDLWRLLGVTRVTVSKMVRALEKLKLVRRARCIARDRRQVIVELTRKARGLLRSVHERVIRPGHVFLAIYAIFGMKEADVGAFIVGLDKLREHFRDTAEFHYPWCDLTTHPNRRKRLGPDVIIS